MLSRLSGASKIAYQLRSELEAGRAEEMEDADPFSAGTVGNASPSKPGRSSTHVRKSSHGVC